MMTVPRRRRQPTFPTLGEHRPLVPGRERVCGICHLAYWIAGGHDCDRTRALSWAARKYGTDHDGYLDMIHDLIDQEN